MRHVVTLLVETTTKNKTDLEASVTLAVLKSETVIKVYDISAIEVSEEETVL